MIGLARHRSKVTNRGILQRTCYFDAVGRDFMIDQNGAIYD